MKDRLTYLIDTDFIDREKAKVGITLFYNYKIPLKTFVLDITFPKTMIENLKKTLKIEELDEDFRDSLLMIFRDCQTAVMDYSVKEEELLSLTECKFGNLTLSTLGKPFDIRDTVYRKILSHIKEMEKVSFADLIFRKVIKLFPSSQLIEDYVDFCVKNKKFDKLKGILNYPLKHRDISENSTLKLANIAVFFEDYETAERLFSVLLNNNPSNPYALIGKAQCLYQAGDENYLMYLQKAYHFNKRITVQVITKTFNFRRKNCSVFEVISLKEGMELADLPPEAIENVEKLSIPYRYESAKGSIYFIKSELEAWKNTMDSLQIISKRFN